jgi:hypothetical protein
MNCLRCNSSMHVEQYDDLLDSRNRSFYGMHCLMCRDIVDPLILEHRRDALNQGSDMPDCRRPCRPHQLESTGARIGKRP